MLTYSRRLLAYGSLKGVANKSPKKDHDEITVAKSIFDEIVEFAESDDLIESDKKRAAKMGGKARAAKSQSKRSAIAKKAATARWEKEKA